MAADADTIVFVAKRPHGQKLCIYNANESVDANNI